MRKWLRVGVAAAIVVIVGWHLRPSDDHDATQRKASTAPSVSGVRNADVAARAAATPVNPDTLVASGRRRQAFAPVTSEYLALPPAGTKVADVLHDLQAAADRGDPRAECRVGVELQRCASLFRAQKARENRPAAETIAQTYASQSTRDAFLAGQEKQRAALAADAAMCEGIDADAAKRSGHYLWNAANAGSVAAMSKYARDPPIDAGQSAEYADEIIRYRDNAARFLSGAVDGGDVMALYVSWFGATSGLSMLGKGVFERNPYAGLVYATAASPLVSGARRRQVDESIAGLRRELGPTLSAQAESQGNALRLQHFSRAIPAASGSDDGAVDPAECEGTR